MAETDEIEPLWKQAHDTLLAFHRLSDPRTPHVVVVEKHKAYKKALAAAKAALSGRSEADA